MIIFKLIYKYCEFVFKIILEIFKTLSQNRFIISVTTKYSFSCEGYVNFKKQSYEKNGKEK